MKHAAEISRKGVVGSKGKKMPMIPRARDNNPNPVRIILFIWFLVWASLQKNQPELAQKC
jgi:hypothetical protein